MKETELRFQETDRKFQETDRRSRETDRQLRELGIQIGGLGNKFGSFTEGLAFPSLKRYLQERYHIDNTTARFERRLPNGRIIEFDAFGYTNGEHNNAVVVEVKSRLQPKHLDEFVDELHMFRTLFPEFARKHLYGIVACVDTLPQDLKRQVFEHGLHLAIIHDDVFDVSHNPDAINFNA